MIKDVDKLRDNDQLVVDLTAKEALTITALPVVLQHYVHPSYLDELLANSDPRSRIVTSAIALVAHSINDGTLESAMTKLGHAMEVAVHLRRQK